MNCLHVEYPSKIFLKSKIIVTFRIYITKVLDLFETTFALRQSPWTLLSRKESPLICTIQLDKSTGIIFTLPVDILHHKDTQDILYHGSGKSLSMPPQVVYRRLTE